MYARPVIGTAVAALSLLCAVPVAAHGPAETVTPHFEKGIPNIPGKTLKTVIVEYPPAGESVAHKHADSSFIFAYVLSGEIESKVNDEPAKVYRAGQSWYEPPASKHLVSRNASKTKPAKLLAVFVLDSDEKTLTAPIK
ncbi:cupin domain-containing protein [Sinorhizobium sp. 7-81]|uniref:cupin domain-containing protein n=1 Tax=Sinorhizobium sp. 8-89 TaxID=3049089 RepID=UPI0024C39152|nr:cupin domain-containing protein [Sinorhizobium sp. 8-89]MDK1494722.1 cupin domain-containing protein [Sinorhizobium sp. 8-89]